MRSTRRMVCASAPIGGASSARPRARYPGTYTPRPSSRQHVLHLGHWYAQSHPTEDFAETFAVWLQPKARWRRDYAEWPGARETRIRQHADGRDRQAARRASAIAARSNRCPRATRRSASTIGANARVMTASSAATTRGCSATSRRALRGRVRCRRDVSSARSNRSCGGCWCAARGCIRTWSIMRSRRFSRRVEQLDLVLRDSRRDSKRRVVRLHERVVLDVLRRNREKYTL